MRKILTFVLALVLVFGCMSFTAFAEADYALTLRVEVFDRSIAGLNIEDCWQLRYAQEKFGDPNGIKLEFVPVSRWEEGDILTTQISGQTAADICVTYNGDLVNSLIADDGVKVLDDLIAEYGQNIVAFLGENLLSYGAQDHDNDGVKDQFTIPARRISVVNQGAFVRSDWLAELGMEEPTSIDELEEYLYAAKDANLGGEMTIPFSYAIFESNPMFAMRYYISAFLNFSEISEEDWFAYKDNPEMLPGAKEAFQLFNKWYHDGILYENFAVDTDSTIGDTYMTQGYFGYFLQQYDQPWRTDKNYQSEMAKNVEGAEWIPVNAWANIYDGKTYHDNYDAAGLTVFIPGWVSDEVAAAAIKYLDWMCQPENMFALQNGTEGINYAGLNEDGLPIGAVTTENVPDENKLHAGDVAFMANGYYFGDDAKNAAYVALSFPGYEDVVARSVIYSNTDAWTQISFTVPIEAATDYSATVITKQNELIAQTISCDPANFDAVWDEYIQAILDAGADKVIEAYRQAYLDGNYRGTFPGAN
ncbi:MAG: hypothetical protein IJC48_11540 [Clostridia bacterium]|nr:hypothetical protein [Clostridia bacterium]MBQ4157820.1 hypothetical protein [Clostridia bacterium]